MPGGCQLMGAGESITQNLEPDSIYRLVEETLASRALVHVGGRSFHEVRQGMRLGSSNAVAPESGTYCTVLVASEPCANPVIHWAFLRSDCYVDEVRNLIIPHIAAMSTDERRKFAEALFFSRP